MRPTAKEYKKLYAAATPRSPAGKDFAVAFVVGGALCALGQLLSNVYKDAGLPEDTAALLVSCSLIVLSGLLTGLGVYDNIARHAGAGTLVPITGFANSVVAPALEFKSEGWVLGVGAKMFLISGPVIVYGTAASLLAGLVAFALGRIG